MNCTRKRWGHTSLVLEALFVGCRAGLLSGHSGTDLRFARGVCIHKRHEVTFAVFQGTVGPVSGLSVLVGAAVWFSATTSCEGLLLLHPSPVTFTLHPSPFTLHPSSFTLHPAPFSLHSSPCTLDWKRNRLVTRRCGGRVEETRIPRGR